MILIARVCKAERDAQLSKILEIQLRMNLLNNTSRRNNPFAIVLANNANPHFYWFYYPINTYKPTRE